MNLSQVETISWMHQHGSENQESSCLRHGCRWQLSNSLRAHVWETLPRNTEATWETLQRNTEARAQATRSDVPQNPFKVSEDIGTMRRRKVAFETSCKWANWKQLPSTLRIKSLPHFMR